MSARAIETHYAGYRFRSRLEARWAVFFRHLDIDFQYEHQGYMVNGQPYLPDFRLKACGTWVEVKGSEEELDHDLMLAAAAQLPERPRASKGGPRLLILGPIPDAPEAGDLGWVGLEVLRVWQGEIRDGDETFMCSVQRGRWHCECGCLFERDGNDFGTEAVCPHLAAFARQQQGPPEIDDIADEWWGFGAYHERNCPAVLRDTSCATPVSVGGPWLTPAPDDYAEHNPKVAEAYRAARMARFEHGEKG